MNKYAIYNINSQLQALYDVCKYDSDNNRLVNMDTGEIIEISTLHELLNQKEELILNTIEYYKNLNKYNENIKSEIENLKNKKMVLEEKQKNVEELLKFALKGQKFNNGVHDITYRKSTSVEIKDINIIPDDFKKTKIEYQVDKLKLKEALKNNANIAGAELVTKNNIIIK